MRTPQDSPVGGIYPDGLSSPGTPDSPSDKRMQLAQRLAPGFGDPELSPAEAAAQDEDYRLYDNPPISPSIDESSLDYPSRSLSNISENAELDTSFSIPPTLASSALQSAASTPTEVVLASSLASSQSLSSGTDPIEASFNNAAGRFASVASSGISLFGVSRMNGTSEGVVLGRDRSDSDSSSLAVPASDKQIGRIEEEEKEDVFEAPAPPLLVPSRSYRATRERRRVNISGRMLVPISEPANEEDIAPVSAAAGPHPPTLVNEAGRPRSNTDPNTLAVPLGLARGRDTAIVGGRSIDGTVEDESEKRLRRKVSAPSLLLVSASTTASPPPVRAAVSTTAPASLSKTATLSLPPTLTRRHHNSLTFPSRGTSSFVRPLLPQRSALTALLSAKSDSPSASNPFSMLYAALASRATDALTLSLYFPHSKTPAKKLKVGVKKDLSVEEVIGAGLWAYWEEGREPTLEVGTAGETDETTKWNLRIVEDDGEVDEDFPGSSFFFAQWWAVLTMVGTQLSTELELSRRSPLTSSLLSKRPLLKVRCHCPRASSSLTSSRFSQGQRSEASPDPAAPFARPRRPETQPRRRRHARSSSSSTTPTSNAQHDARSSSDRPWRIFQTGNDGRLVGFGDSGPLARTTSAGAGRRGNQYDDQRPE